MQGGDISNSAPMTVMIHVDCFLKRTPHEKRSFGIRRTTEHVDLELGQVNMLYRVGLGITATLECFCTDGSDLHPWEERLDHLGLNPFRYFTTYPDVAALARELPYRPSVMGVVDPPRAGAYGSWAMDMNRLTRT